MCLPDKRIAMLSAHIPPYYSGAGKRALNQAKYLVQLGYEVVFITTTPNEEKMPGLDMVTIRLPAVYETATPAGALCRQSYHPVLFFKLLVVLARKKVRLIHCIPAFSWFAFNAVLAAKILGIKILTEITLDGTDDPVTLKNRKAGRAKLLVFKLSDGIINISPLLVSRCKEVGISEDKIHLIPNSVNTERFAPLTPNAKKDLRIILGLERFEQLLVYVGVIRPRKRVAELISIFKTVKAEFKESGIILCGPYAKDDESRDYFRLVKDMIKEENLKESVIFTGEVANVDQWMKAGDLFVFASEREGFGTVLVEAMSTGLPVVAMHIAQITDYILGKNNKSGIIVNTAEDFSRAIIDLLGDQSRYHEISHAARERATSYFSEEVVMDKYTNIYSKYLNDQKEI